MPFFNLLRDKDFLKMAFGVIGTIWGVSQVTYIIVSEPEISYTIAATAHKSSVNALAYFATPPFLAGHIFDTTIYHDVNINSLDRISYVSIPTENNTNIISTNHTHMSVKHLSLGKQYLGNNTAQTNYDEGEEPKAAPKTAKFRQFVAEEKAKEYYDDHIVHALPPPPDVSHTVLEFLWNQMKVRKHLWYDRFTFWMLVVLHLASSLGTCSCLYLLRNVIPFSPRKATKMSTEIVTLTTENQRKGSTLQEQAKTMVEMQAKIRTMEKDALKNPQLQAEVNDRDVRISELESAARGHENSIHDLKREVVDQTEVIKRERRNHWEGLKMATCRTETLRRTNDDLTAQLLSVTGERDTLSREKTISSQVNQKLQTEVAATVSSLKDSRDRTAKTEAQVSTLQETISEHVKENRELQLIVNKLTRERDDALKNADSLQTTHKSAETRMKQDHAKVLVDMEGKYHKARNDLEAANKEKQSLNSDLSSMRANNGKLQSDLEEADLIIAALRDRLDSMDAAGEVDSSTPNATPSDHNEPTSPGTASQDGSATPSIKEEEGKPRPKRFNTGCKQCKAAGLVCDRHFRPCLNCAERKTICSRSVVSKLAIKLKGDCNIDRSLDQVQNLLDLRLCPICTEPHRASECPENTSLTMTEERQNEAGAATGLVVASRSALVIEEPKTGPATPPRPSKESVSKVEPTPAVHQSQESSEDVAKKSFSSSIGQSKWADSSFKPTPKSEIDAFYRKRAFMTTFGSLPPTDDKDERNIDERLEHAGDAAPALMTHSNPQSTSSLALSTAIVTESLPRATQPSSTVVEFTPSQPPVMDRHNFAPAAQSSGMTASRFASINTTNNSNKAPSTPSTIRRSAGRGQGRARTEASASNNPNVATKAQLPAWLQAMQEENKKGGS